MSNPSKRRKILIAIGIACMINSLPVFLWASQKSKEADVIRQTNEVRAEVRESSARFNRTMGFMMLVGGAVVLIIGLASGHKAAPEAQTPTPRTD